MDIYKALGKKVREQRLKTGISQEKLAEMCNIYPSYIGIIERGDKKLSVATLVKVANALNVSADYLLSDSITVENRDLVEKVIGKIMELNQSDTNLIVDIIEKLHKHFKN